jgi:hypothetical protein
MSLRNTPKHENHGADPLSCLLKTKALAPIFGAVFTASPPMRPPGPGSQKSGENGSLLTGADTHNSSFAFLRPQAGRSCVKAGVCPKIVRIDPPRRHKKTQKLFVVFAVFSWT